MLVRNGRQIDAEASLAAFKAYLEAEIAEESKLTAEIERVLEEVRGCKVEFPYIRSKVMYNLAIPEHDWFRVARKLNTLIPIE